MSEYVDGNSPDWMEGWQQIQCLFGGKTKNGSTFGDDNECLLVQVVGINVTDGSVGKLLRKLAVSPRQVVSCMAEKEIHFQLFAKVKNCITLLKLGIWLKFFIIIIVRILLIKLAGSSGVAKLLNNETTKSKPELHFYYVSFAPCCCLVVVFRNISQYFISKIRRTGRKWDFKGFKLITRTKECFQGPKISRFGFVYIDSLQRAQFQKWTRRRNLLEVETR